MINQIKHNSPSSILSQFNPIASLKPQIRKAVNERFILPILEAFFLPTERGGIDNFSALDPDKLITEIEFVETKNFVKTYIYKEIIDEISKNSNGEIDFKPKYVITFDRDLANFKKDETCYPYRSIFKDETQKESSILFGVIRLGEAPILYYVYINLQQLIRFIKTLPEEKNDVSEISKIIETEEDKRNKLFDTVIFEKQKLLRNATPIQTEEIEQEINRLEQVRVSSLQGQGGKLRINLAWHTTDDLDLHIVTPDGREIAFNNKTVEHQGVIGELDVDKNAGSENAVSNPQENVNFDAMPAGEHKIYVNFYSMRERNEVPFTITIIPENGEGRIFSDSVVGKGTNKYIADFEYKETGLVITKP
jgi:hypothetical protein